MRHFLLMTKICNLLRAAGLQAVPPEPDDATSSALEIKRTASKHHMDRIRSDDTEAVLVVNVSRPGAENYVGPNALAEIGVAFALDRKVFLLYGMPASYADELRAWG